MPSPVLWHPKRWTESGDWPSWKPVLQKKKQGGRVVLHLRGYHLAAPPAVWPQSRAGAATGVSRARAASAAVAVEDLAARSFRRKRLWYLLWEENNPWLWRTSSREITWMPFTFCWRLCFSCKNSWLLPFNFAGNLCSHCYIKDCSLD